MKPKYGGKGRGREKIKIIVPFRSNPTRNRKFQKNKKKIQKIKKYHSSFISGQNLLENAEKDRKQKLSIRFVPSRPEIENYNKIAKKFKKLKYTIMVSFEAKISWKMKRKRGNKNYHSV